MGTALPGGDAGDHPGMTGVRSKGGGCEATGSLIVDLTSKSGIFSGGSLLLSVLFTSIFIGNDVVSSGRSLSRESSTSASWSTSGVAGRSGMIGITLISSSDDPGSSSGSTVSSCAGSLVGRASSYM